MKKSSYKFKNMNIIDDTSDIDLGKRFKYDNKKKTQVCICTNNIKLKEENYKDRYDKINEINNLETHNSNC